MYWRLRQVEGGMLAYKNISIKCTKAIKYYHKRREFNFLRLKTKHFYSFLNNRLKSRPSLPVVKDSNGDKYTTDTDKAEVFTREFEKVFTIDNGKCPCSEDCGVNCNDVMNFSAENVCKYLKNVNSSSAAGPDGLPGIFWHSLHGSLSFPMSMLFKASYDSAMLPAMWKESFITPIHKKGDISSVLNYRPVALTCVPCRVMEAIIRDVIMAHLTSNNLLTDYQHGFRKQHSTGLQLLQCLNSWSAALDNGHCVDICYIDFAKAFDTASIPKLLIKMTAYGGKGQFLRWITDFLQNRKMRLKFNNCYLTAVLQTSGIAQGRVWVLCAFPFTSMIYLIM